MATVLGTITTKPRFPDVHEKLVVTMTGAGGGAISVAHSLGYTPSSCIIGAIYDIAGPAAGPVVNLDVQTVTAGMDGTNVYIFTNGPGTVELYVG